MELKYAGLGSLEHFQPDTVGFDYLLSNFYHNFTYGNHKISIPARGSTQDYVDAGAHAENIVHDKKQNGEWR